MHMVRKAAIVVLLASITPVWGQRAIGRIEFRELEDDLVFDVNENPVDINFVPPLTQPDLNFSPRVVFTPDSQRAFVNFPGSNKVAVFSVPDGEVLQIIEVRTNPTQLSITPDGRKIAVPCIFLKENLPRGDNFEGDRVGSISIIDVDTYQVQNLDLQETLFSFGNNIAFSADSSTGYVASAGTDEILRFDVATATEVGQRLKMGDATRPMSITMGPDGSFFGVVLVGSTALDPREVPDSIQIIDTQTFSVVKSLSFDVDTTMELPYNFLPENNVVFSPDGKLAFIGEQANSQGAQAAGFPPELVADRALLIDMETEELMGVFDLGGGISGGQAGAAYVSPDGRYFVLPTALDVGILNVETQVLLDIQPFRREFRPTSRIAFAADGSAMYMASPLRDFLETIRLSTGEVFRGTFMGGTVQRTIGNNEFNFASAPLDTALTPDQKYLTTVNFNANAVEIFKPTFGFFVPELLADNVVETGEGDDEGTEEGEEQPPPDRFFTGFALNNILDEPAELVLTGFTRLGAAYEDMFEDPEEEGGDPVLVQDYANPTELTLQPHEQISQTSNGLLQPDPLVNLDGWLDVDNDRNALSGIFLSFDDQVLRMDGGGISNSTLQLFLFPEVRVTDGFATQLVFTNPNLSGSGVVIISLLDREGNVLAQSSQTINARFRSSFFVRDPNPDDSVTEGLFNETVFEDFQGGYLAAFTTSGLVAYERYYDRNRMSVLNAISLQEDSPTAAFTRLFVPHVVLFGGADTIINLINFTATQEEMSTGAVGAQGEGEGEEPVPTPVTLTLHNDLGEVIAGPVTLDIFAQNALRSSLIDIFELEDTGQTVSGWLEIESETPGILGDAEIQGFFGQAMTTVPLQGPSFLKSVFPHVAQGLGFVTGVALLNPGEQAAEVELELYRQDGTLVQRVNRTILPGQRLIGLVPELFPDLAEEVLGGSIIFTSNVPLIDLELFFKDNARVLSAVPSQGLVAAPQE